MKFLVAPPSCAPAADCPTKLLDSQGEAAPLDKKIEASFREVDEKTAAAKEPMDPIAEDPGLRGVLSAVDLYAGLKHQVTRYYNGQVVTNAWLKMYEMTSQLGLFEHARAVVDGKPTFRAFCNAELPGAFVCALNHYACTWFPDTQFRWAASSLYPDGGGAEAANDPSIYRDALGDAYGLYEHNRDNWLMDASMRGDVTSVADVKALVQRAKGKLGEIDLYTSDAGIDVSSDYMNQERLTAHIHYGQTLTGLMSLREGGALVVKTYTFNHPFSASLAGLCAALFDVFYITKPVTSRPANSEVYFVGMGFRGLGEETERLLLAVLENFDFDTPLYPLGLEETTTLTILAAGRQIHMRQQVAFLDETMEFFAKYRDNVKALRAGLAQDARTSQAAWLSDNPIKRLEAYCKIPDDRDR